MDQRIIDLNDRYTHGALTRRAFLNRLAALAGGTAGAAAFLPLLQTTTPGPRPCPSAIRA